VSLASFEVLTPRRIVFGIGAVARTAEHVRELLRDAPERARIALVTGRDRSRHGLLRASLEETFEVTAITVAHEPTVEDALAAVERVRVAHVRAVIAIGGGSAIDLGKAIAALAPNEGEPLEFLEVVGRGRALVARPLPFLAIPTTAGTGAEATKNAVLAALTSSGARVKVSLRSDAMVPDLALVDPALTVSVPRDVTAATGLDALTQVIEPYLSHAATPFTDALCREAIPRGARALPRVCADGADLDARTEMSLVSLHGGLALANAKLGAVHGFAGPLGGLLGAAHGAICARLLPVVLEINLRALRARAPSSPALERLADVARWLTGDPQARPEDAAVWAGALVRDLAIPSLGEMGLAPESLGAVADQSANSSSMKGNPIALERTELLEILERACG